MNALAEPWLSVIGVGEDGMASLAPAAQQRIAAARHLVGSQRLLAILPEVAGQERLAWLSPLADTFPLLDKWRGAPSAVLATGDPLCYGIGTSLLKRYPQNEMVFFPALSAFALARAKLGWTAHTCETLTLHGRPLRTLLPYLYPRARLLILADSERTPCEVAQFLCDHGYKESHIIALQHLGGAQEKQVAGSVADWMSDKLAVAPFHVVAVACQAEANATGGFRALKDDSFEHDGQITKQGMRGLAVAQLAPFPRARLWDLGAGAASVSIAWLVAARSGVAIAVEKNETRCHAIAENAKHFGVASCLSIHCATVEEFLRDRESQTDCQAPDAIFFGGGLETQDGLLRCAKLLQRGGTLVAHAVTLESEQQLLKAHKTLGGDLARVTFAHSETLGARHGLRPAMPVMQWAWRKTEAQ